MGCVTTNNLVHPRYNAFAAARSLGFGKLPVVFVDGHCQSPMDDGWDAMFAKVQYIKHLDPGTCFKHMIIIPTGYQAAISTGITPTQNCPATPRVREFGDVFLRSFGIEPLPSCTAEGKHQLTMVMRENYKAHPRHNGRIDTRLRNEKDVLRELQKFAASSDLGALRFVRSCLLLCFVVSLTSPRLSPLFLFFFVFVSVSNVVEGRFAHMPLKAQLQAVSRSCALVGVHGAGMTHVLFMPTDARVLEIRTPGFQRPHFSACVG